MLKRIVPMLLVLSMLLTLLAGCGGSNQQNNSGSQNSGAGTTSGDTGDQGGSGDASAPVTVKVSYPCLVIVPSPEATKTVEDAINQHLEEIGSGVRLELEALDGNSYATTIDMKQIGNEQVDLYMCLGNLADQVGANKIQPITQYINTKLQPTMDITGETFLGATTFNGEVYAVPCYKTTVLTYYAIFDTEVAKNDLGLELGDTLTVDQLTEKLAILHEKYPNMVSMGVRPGANGSPNNFCLSAIYGSPEYYMVTDMGSGVCVVGEDTTVQNMYDTDYFRQVCKTAYEWNQAGYVNKDASVATEEGYDLMKAGRASCYIIGYGGYNPQITDASSDSTHGKSVLYVPITSTANAPSGLDWCVSYNCKNPEAACEALNLFYTDAFVMNSILCGVEGRDWVDTGLGSSPDDKVVDFPEGLDAFTVPYYAYFTCGIMGNEYLDWIYIKDDGTFEDQRPGNFKVMQESVASPIYGFTLDTNAIKNAAAAVSNVESQYLSGLLTGELDPDVYIPEFISQLKSAGIDTIVTEAQTQLDAWLAANK